MIQVKVKQLLDSSVKICLNPQVDLDYYRVYWSDSYTEGMKYRMLKETTETEYTLNKATHKKYYFRVACVKDGKEIYTSNVISSNIKKVFHEQLEKLSRGLIAVKANTGIFLSWRLFLDEVKGYCKTGVTGANFQVYKNGEKLTIVTDSTNYIDINGTTEDSYAVAPIIDGKEFPCCNSVKAWSSGQNYIDIPMQIPEDGVTPKGDTYTYNVNDMSVGDVDGDGEYEYIVKWDPSNSQDVSIKGYTGKCYIDCYKLDGRLLWRLDMGVNIRAGAHYTQFMVYDFNGDGKAEMSVKTAPGTKMTRYNEDGSIASETYITMPQSDLDAGYSHKDDYRCSADDYFNHLVDVFMNWTTHEEVVLGQWPRTLEQCFGIEEKYNYPLNKEDAVELVMYFIKEFAPSRSPKNKLDEFEGFIYEGPEYLTMFSGDGSEIETIPFKFTRVDDGLMWGDYAMNRIEPCNRVDRFLSGVAYLDGERPYLIICRGYYTRTTVVAYSFFNNKHEEHWSIDTGFVKMSNPFRASAAPEQFKEHPHIAGGTDPVYGTLAGQGNHSLSTADVDNDGCQEIIYGGAVIDHDGSLLYSGFDYLPDGKTYAKLGHGDALHVAKIDPDRPGYQIFSVFEGAKAAPYGYAFRDAETCEIFFGQYAEEDLGRAMIGDINPNVRGLQMWVKETYDVNGNVLSDKLLGTNQSIRWAADLSTQVTDGVDYINEAKKNTGVINDNTHGVLLAPEGTTMNNGTKGNPCLVADIFGDWREELVVRKADNSAVRIYTNVDITNHKLFTLMHDTMYRTGIAWQNNCYNQPCYTKFYLASDMDFKDVLPWFTEEN